VAIVFQGIGPPVGFPHPPPSPTSGPTPPAGEGPTDVYAKQEVSELIEQL